MRGRRLRRRARGGVTSLAVPIGGRAGSIVTPGRNSKMPRRRGISTGAKNGSSAATEPRGSLRGSNHMGIRFAFRWADHPDATVSRVTSDLEARGPTAPRRRIEGTVVRNETTPSEDHSATASRADHAAIASPVACLVIGNLEGLHAIGGAADDRAHRSFQAPR